MRENLMAGLFKRGLELIERIGASADDTDDIRLQKTLLVRIALMIGVAGVIWGGIYLAFGEPLAGSIPFTYAIISALSIIIFALTGRYGFFRFSQLLLILVLPFLLMVVLGGFVNGSGIIIWALLSPLGALMFAGRQQAIRWFLA